MSEYRVIARPVTERWHLQAVGLGAAKADVVALGETDSIRRAIAIASGEPVSQISVQIELESGYPTSLDAMASVRASDSDASHNADLGYQILKHGPVRLFRRREAMSDTVDALFDQGYQVISLDASGWRDTQSMGAAVEAAFDMPRGWGRTLDSIDDGLYDVSDHDYGWRVNSTGLVVAITHYERFAAADFGGATRFMEMLTNHSRLASLRNQRLLALVHCDENFRFESTRALGEWDSST